jgi:hypothetical protein
MATPLMIKVLERGQKQSDYLLPLVIRWDGKSRRIRVDSFGIAQLLWLVEFIILFPILGLGSLLLDGCFLLLANSEENALHKEIMDGRLHVILTRIILCLVYVGGCVFIIWIFFFCKDFALVWNGLLEFEENTSIQLKAVRNGNVQSFDFIGNFMQSILLCGVILPPIPSFLLIIKCHDPYYTVARLVLPHSWFNNLGSKLIIALVRFLALTLTAYEIARILTIIVFALFSSAILTQRCICWINRLYGSLGKLDKLRGGKHVSLYRQVGLLIFLYNNSTACFILLLLLVLELLFMAFSIIFIKLHDSVPLPIALTSAVFVVGLVVVVTFLFPIATGVYKQSLDMKRKWKSDVALLEGNKRYLRITLRSLKVFYLYVGFGECEMRRINKESATGFQSGVVDHTIDVLLAVQ